MSREQRAADVVKHAPPSAKGTLARAFDGSGGRTNAIKAMCLVCLGFEREAIRNCTGYCCPLWQYRPFQAGAAGEPDLLTSTEPTPPSKDLFEG